MIAHNYPHAIEWMKEEVGELTVEKEFLKPSEHSEKVRYLPESVTPYPGPFSFDLNPYMKEIVDCFDVDSPVLEVSLMKGVQTTATTAAETILLYCMDYIKTVSTMFMTADRELAHARIENNIIPMINHSGLSHIIQSADTGNARKSGKTRESIQWKGPGVLYPFGANNADKMRMFSIWYMIKDELDAWPDTVGKDGDPDQLSDDRLSAYWERRKIFRASTPLEDPSKIHTAYMRGDRRKYNVLCKSCGFPQVLQFGGKIKDTGRRFGLVWELEEGTLLNDSVRYLCENCGHPHEEHDKTKLFSPTEGAQWVPTAKAVIENTRSYHLSALYSPDGMQPWSKCVDAYLKGYDPEKKKVKNFESFRIFYNNILGEPFKRQGGTVSIEVASAHRRVEYTYGQVPNEYALETTGSKILFLTCTVDVQKNNLAVAVFGWTRGRRAFLVNYWRLSSSVDTSDDPDAIPTENLDDPETWGRLREILELQTYIADDGRIYPIALTFVDAGYIEKKVSDFCSEYETGVYPTLGRTEAAKKQKFDEFGEFRTKTGQRGFRLMVNRYKDTMSSSLRTPWDGQDYQPEDCLNLPTDVTNEQIKELTAEYRRELKDKDTGRSLGFEWYRKRGADNELFDLWGYGLAQVDVLAWDIMVNQLEQENVNMIDFYNHIEEHALFFTESVEA